MMQRTAITSDGGFTGLETILIATANLAAGRLPPIAPKKQAAKQQKRERMKLRSRANRIANVPVGKLGSLWTAMCKYISTAIQSGKGVTVPVLGRFMYNEASKGPAFVFNEEFLRTYRLRHRMPVVKSPVNIIDLNFTLLGRTAKLRKDYVRPAIVEMMAQIGEAAAKADRPLRIEFPFVGWLNADHRRAHFCFWGQ